MRQLTGLDVQFLALETPRQYGHVGGLAVLDPSTRPNGRLELADVHQLIAERLPLLPPFRWRLQQVPLGLDYPYWIDDPDFDLEYHVRELALAPPPTDAKLAEQVARIFARPLDRARPLWEVYVIQGLQEGHVGMLTKIHHAAVDGMSGAEIMTALLDLSPEGREVPATIDDSPPDRPPGEAGMLARGLLGFPRYFGRVASGLPGTLPNLEELPAIGELPGAKVVGRTTARVARAIRRRPSRMLERTNLTRPRTSFNGRISPHRRFAFGQLSLAEVKAIKNEHGVTVNDVVVSLCAGAVRRWLIEHEELPDDPLVAQVPVSVRSEAQRGTYGNRVGMMSVPLFTNEADPRERLRLTHEALRAAKERHKALPAELLQDATQFIPPAVFASASRISFSLATRAPVWNLVISNVPGPQVPIYCAGARLEANYPVSVITDGMGLNITVMSYCGHLDFGIVADREQMRDVWKLMQWLRESLAELRPAKAPEEVPATAPEEVAAKAAGEAPATAGADEPAPAPASTEAVPPSRR
jgi:WS/DGAT/MGAT family acyltransferase